MLAFKKDVEKEEAKDEHKGMYVGEQEGKEKVDYKPNKPARI